MKCIHYGATAYNEHKFASIKNIEFVKPAGGLWVSPINSEWGWKDWCEMEGFRVCDEKNSFTIDIKDSAKIFIINSYEDLLKAPLTGRMTRHIDFELMCKKYDAIWLTAKGQEKTRFTEPGLYGWDCESILIMDKTVITI
jgi:hypothetical protein